MNLSQICVYTPQDQRNLRTFNILSLSAMATWAVTTILIGKGYVDRGPLAWILVAAAVVLMLLMVRSYMHFLRHADELLRKIQIEGLALGFGAGVIFMLAWRLFERMGAPKLDIADGVLPMVAFWAIGQYLGIRRYSAGAEEEQQ